MSGYMSQAEASERLTSPENLALLLEGLRLGGAVDGAARGQESVEGKGGPAVSNSDETLLPTPPATQPQILQVEIKPLHAGGRREGDTALTEVERVTTGVLANLIGAKAAGEIMGVSRGHAHQLGEGRSTSPTPGRDSTLDSSVKTQIESRLVDVKSKAIDKLLSTLDVITDEGVRTLSIKDAADVSSKLAGVIDKTTPRDKSGTAVAQVIVYTPRTKGESEYDVIEVGATVVR